MKRNINEDVDISKVEENDMPFWMRPNVGSLRAHAMTTMGGSHVDMDCAQRDCQVRFNS